MIFQWQGMETTLQAGDLIVIGKRSGQGSYFLDLIREGEQIAVSRKKDHPLAFLDDVRTFRTFCFYLTASHGMCFEQVPRGYDLHRPEEAIWCARVIKP